MKIFVADTSTETEFGHLSRGDIRRGSDPIVQALPDLFVPFPATTNELLAHAGAREQAAFDRAAAAHLADASAQAHAERLNSARLEVSRRETEIRDRRDAIDALADDTDPLTRSRLETAFVIGVERLDLAKAALSKIEGDPS